MEELNNKQEKSGWGGKRLGAGRPVGSKNRPSLYEELSWQECDKIVDKIMEKVEQGDPKILQFIAEQVWGKAPQSMDITTKGNEIKPVLVEFLNGKNKDTNPE